MQFKNPEILYFLILLLLPILVHLFQLQKFKKTPFTNVAFLQKLVLQTRKSSQLKKWLILTSRLLLFSGLIFAFSQPYFSNKKAAEIQHNFIYLDNSLSLNSEGEKGNLLQNAIKEIIENSSEKELYSLLTNSNFYENLNADELKSILIKLQFKANSRSLKEVLLKIESLKLNKTKTLYKSFLISDFQIFNKNKKIDFTNVTSLISFIKLKSTQKNNLSIDSVFIDSKNGDSFLVNAVIKNQGTEKNNIPIALYNNETVFAKQTFSIQKDSLKIISFPIQNTLKLNGKISLNFNDAFEFDNHFFFTLNSTKKINVLCIGKNQQFLSKIYTKNEFNFLVSSLQNVNYNLVPKQELIILNEIDHFPKNLVTQLEKHLNDGKSLVIIPSEKADINTYNSFFNQLKIGNIKNGINDSIKITDINFKAPFFKDVFSKTVKNFQYPFVKNYLSIDYNNFLSIINFENQQPFISQLSRNKGNIYSFSGAINSKNSNFIHSPLVVPVFYNFGKFSSAYPTPYYTIGKNNTIDIPIALNQDNVLSIENKETSFIPLQQSFSSKVTLQTAEKPSKNGIYSVKNNTTIIISLAFNYNSSESKLDFLDINTLIKGNKNLSQAGSIASILKENQEKNKVTWLWKWFLALAIVSLLFEILILKFFKP